LNPDPCVGLRELAGDDIKLTIRTSAASRWSFGKSLANSAPVTVTDSYTATLNTQLTVSSPGVLGNDTDADTNTPTAALVSGTTPFRFPVTLSAPSSVAVTVQYYTSNSTALAGSDYTAVPLTTLTFSPGDPLTKYITVNVTGDTTKESNELFSVTLINPTIAT